MTDLPPGGHTSANFNATCPAGSRVVGSGFYSSVTDVGFVKGYGTFGGGIMFNNTNITVHDLHVQAMCIQFAAGTPGAPKVRASRAKDGLRADEQPHSPAAGSSCVSTWHGCRPARRAGASPCERAPSDSSGWTRTTDLTIMSGAL